MFTAMAMRHVATIAEATYLVRPAAESRHGGRYVPLLFLTYLPFNYSCQTSYPKIYRAQLRQFFRVGS